MLIYFQDNLFVFYSSVGLLGLMVGSFINVVAYRLPKMMMRDWEQSARDILQQTPDSTPDKYNLAWPPSSCPKCGGAIKAWCNIPVLSYLLLRGKCNNCKGSIPLRYPIVEVLTGVISLVVALQLGPSMATLWALVLTWSLIAASLIDFDHQLLPDQITLPLLWIGLILNTEHTWVPINEAVFGAAAGYLSLWSVYWLFKLATGKEGMGYGDFKLLAALGAWMGWQAIPGIILYASFVGAIVGICLIVFAKHNRNQGIPFGPYLATAGWLYFLWGDHINVLHFFG